jgi:hypothetical protein
MTWTVLAGLLEIALYWTLLYSLATDAFGRLLASFALFIIERGGMWV